ncbi:GGDEF domain-containing protein [Aquidulcibacter paucihalophilus]|uniref:GGDEF domain-containing protein n=1 Tax=Aquidulcibacter paucihalophilus TaxID=1978549 RepID=UPI0012FF77E5|nr:GGDEF domain-containing protein [Aquidulcibacter paucihalophilus]
MSFAQHQSDEKPKATLPSLQPKSVLERATQAAAAAKRNSTAEARATPPSSASAESQAAEKPMILGIPPQELTPLVRRALKHLSDQVASLKSDRARLVERLRRAEELADRDTLVPVFNRRAFERELNRVISFAHRYEVQASLVYFDLDGFKQINDRFGHPAGDAILLAVGETLAANIRESDLVGRVGGDEFAVILAKAGPEDARKKGAQLAEAISRTEITYQGHRLRVGAAYGSYCFESDDTGERALSRADEAMYANKVGRKIQSL